MKRILLCELYHEVNTFNPAILTMDFFRYIRCAEGREVYDACTAIPCSMHGLIDAAEEAGAEIIPAVSFFGSAGGRIADSVLRLFRERMEEHVKNCGTFDAVFCSLHGALVSETEPDVSGAVLEFLRGLAGDRVIAACFDLHANITPKILKNADIITGYQTYPHVDIYETGYRAGRLAMQLLEGKPVEKAAVLLPLMTPPSGYTTESEPFRSVMETGREAQRRGEILDFSVFNVQPWMDIPEIASSVVVEAENRESALQAARRIAKRFYEARDGLWPRLMDVDEIIRIAEREDTPKPVIIADAADSPNSGSLGDSVYEALRLRALHSKLTLGMFVRDERAVKQAFETGVGNEAEFSVGAGYTVGMPGPFAERAKVCSLHEGHYVMEGPAQRGTVIDIGRAAVLRFDNVDVLVCEHPIESGDPQILRHFGIEPTLYDLIAVKANTSFLVPYGKFAGSIFYGDTPGAGAANLKRFQWKNLPKGLYPFEEITEELFREF